MPCDPSSFSFIFCEILSSIFSFDIFCLLWSRAYWYIFNCEKYKMLCNFDKVFDCKPNTFFGWQFCIFRNVTYNEWYFLRVTITWVMLILNLSDIFSYRIAIIFCNFRHEIGYGCQCIIVKSEPCNHILLTIKYCLAIWVLNLQKLIQSRKMLETCCVNLMQPSCCYHACHQRNHVDFPIRSVNQVSIHSMLLIWSLLIPLIKNDIQLYII